MFEKILFPVDKIPYLYNGEKTGKSLIIRTDTDEFLSMVSDEYLLIPNNLVVDEVVKNFSRELDFKDIRSIQRNVFSSPNQTYSTISIDLKYPQMEVKVGDVVGAVMRIENSYDTTKALRVSMNAKRLICSNGLTIDKELFHSKTKHIGNRNAQEVVEEMILTVKENGEEVFMSLNELFRKMASKKLNKRIKGDFVELLADYPNYVQDAVIAEIQKTSPKDLWDLYNCVTWVTTHNMDREKQSTLVAEESLSKSIIRFLN